MSEPVVSIVTPSYNQAQFLEETICSVLDQDYGRLEYVVVDDGSTDGSEEIVHRYSDRLHWWTRQENAGQVGAINLGFRHTSGEYMGFVNSDDTLLPGAVSTMVAELERDPGLVMVYGDSVYTDAQSRQTGYLPSRPWDPGRMVRRADNHVVQPSSIWRRSAWDAAGPLNERGYYFFDMELFLALGSVGKVRRLDGPPLSGYRLHFASKSYGAPLRKAEDYIRVAEEFLPSARLPEEAKPFVREGRARAWLGAAEYFYSGRDLRSARSALRKGVALAPRALTRRDLAIATRILTPSIVREWRRPRREARY